MKKFIEELNSAREHLVDIPKDTEAKRKFKELEKFYGEHVGKRALYKSGKESRVVTIEQVTRAFVLMSYKTFGRSGTTVVRITSNYNSLLCGEDRLEIE